MRGLKKFFGVLLLATICLYFSGCAATLDKIEKVDQWIQDNWW